MRYTSDLNFVDNMLSLFRDVDENQNYCLKRRYEDWKKKKISILKANVALSGSETSS